MHGLGVRPSAWPRTYGSTTRSSNSAAKLKTWWTRPSWSATRRASSTSATEQQPESDAPPHSFRVAPTTWSRPYCSAARAAATEESTPPDMATSTRIPSVSQLGDRGRHDSEGVADVRLGGGRPEGEPDAAGGLLAPEPH